MNILLLMAHSVAEYDDLRMFADLGYDVFSIGAYTDPAHPGDDLRPALPFVSFHPELAEMVAGDQMAHKERLPDGIIDWADTIIVHHYPEQWLFGQWDRIHHKRIVWRTCGQSDFRLEASMRPYTGDGLQIVRFSPKERETFESAGVFAGQDALIRFGKYPDDYGPWIGDKTWVINISQGLAQRAGFTHHQFFEAATADLPRMAFGQGSEEIGGFGPLPYKQMLRELRRARAYLYTGTQPASYTLGLVEAMLSGVPVVSIGPEAMWVPSLFEAHEMALTWSSVPHYARESVKRLLQDHEFAGVASATQRARARDLFDVGRIGPQWVEFLGAP